jgi:RsiW-degrading membrane proteinase PrsW (M82 family)
VFVLPTFYVELTDNDNVILQLIGFVFQVGILEETCKILPVIAYIIWKQRDAQPLMIILIAVFSGLGFAAFENIGYAGTSIVQTIEMGRYGGIEGIAFGTQAAMINAMLRSLSCVFAHAIWSGIFAYYLARAVLSGSRWYVLGFLGLAVPAVLHGVYDWFCGVQPFLAALTIAASFVLFYGYLAKLRQISPSETE